MDFYVEPPVSETSDSSKKQVQTFEDNSLPFVPVTENSERELKVRLDKWLWASRFFKTRALARTAVKNGKVMYNGMEANPNMEIELDDTITIILGKFKKCILIKKLTTRRRNSENAQELFEELSYTPINQNHRSNSNPWRRHQHGNSQQSYDSHHNTNDYYQPNYSTYEGNRYSADDVNFNRQEQQRQHEQYEQQQKKVTRFLRRSSKKDGSEEFNVEENEYSYS